MVILPAFVNRPVSKYTKHLKQKENGLLALFLPAFVTHTLWLSEMNQNLCMTGVSFTNPLA
jgi:hypothetical protein